MSNRGFSCVGLDNAKGHNNVGSALRAAGCYGASIVAISGARYKKAKTDTQKNVKHLPLIQCDDLFDVIPYECVPVAIDLIDGAVPIQDYVHPERAFYIFGAEDATLGHRVLSRCRDIIYIPTKQCMNLAATVNVVLFDRMMKRKEFIIPNKFKEFA